MPDPLEQFAVVVDPVHDHVAVAKQQLRAGQLLGAIVLKADVAPGHRFAIRAVPAGEWIKQYGQPFARSRGISPGDPINADTSINEIPRVDADSIKINPPTLPPWEGQRPTFMGYRRPDGRVGARNWVLVVPTSMCSSHEASMIAMQAELSGVVSTDKYPNVTGVTAIPHTRGCGCPDYEPRTGDDQLLGVVEASMRMLGRYIEHPNVGAVLVIELGCEKTNVTAVAKYVQLGKSDEATKRRSDEGLARFGQQHGKPVITMSVQSSGGTMGTIRRGLELLPQLLEQANRTARTPCDAAELIVGLKCGGSDAFSGLSANPALGVASDLLIRTGGSTIITEIPEFFGAEHLFAARARDRETARKVLAAMERFRRYVDRVGGSMAENPSPGNREGGLINITIKSLGALAKAGAAPVEGVLDYGQLAPRDRRGLYLLYCPSYDQESVPAQVASGCQIVCFTTGRGTGIGNAIAPVIKIASNSAMAARMSGDIDVDAGPIIDNRASVGEIGRKLFDEILAVASGQSVAAERNGHREFMIWSEEGVSL